MPTLHWLTRDNDLSAAEKIPYRLLEEVPDLGAGDRENGNMLIQGDNLCFESAPAILRRTGEVHLHRSTLQHEISF
jgi:hypothetical protein